MELKSIKELFGKHFVIPSYQRGYRWEKQQIEDLLSDIYNFQKGIKDKKIDSEFYCLQPLILSKREDEKWEVVDGQQRLTTIFILLSYLKPVLEILGFPTNLFTIEYETREKKECSSKEFLENITSITEIDKTNIDFYRMSDAFLTIKQWFYDNKNKVNKGDFCNILLKEDYDNEEGVDKASNVRFIWYVIDYHNEKPNETFAKYNKGKINLTNAELIKALFYLTKKDRKKQQIKIGYEWDDIENTLRKEDFWRFINPKGIYTNYINFIFDLIATKYESKIDFKIKKKDRLRTFYIFNELISKNIKIYEESKFDNTRDFLWDEVKTYYRTFVEWYESKKDGKYVYFHLIGFLLQIGKSIETIKEKAEKQSKSQFEQDLKEMIKNHFGEIDFDEITYQDNGKNIQELLLLFNVITTMNSGFVKFSFERIPKWSLEHIHAQNSEEITNEKQKRQLLEEQKKDKFIVQNEEIKEVIDSLLESSEINQVQFEKVQQKIFDLSSDSGETIHSIKNIALLSIEDNSSLNNAPFYKKRDRIKQLDEKGAFIPICTKNVFLKYYSKEVGQNFKWDKNDMDSYLTEIKNTLNDYITFNQQNYGK